MNKLNYVILATLLCITAIPFTPTAEIPAEDFTHAVFGEEFTATWCVYCPSAAENLMKIYDDIPDEQYYDDKFFFVALITDVNDKSNPITISINGNRDKFWCLSRKNEHNIISCNIKL